MVWNRPRNVWQWLLLITPAIAALLALWAVETFWPIPPLRHNGHEIMNVQAVIGREANVTLGTISVLSLVLAVRFTRDEKFWVRVGNMLMMTVALTVVNCFVAFGGCSLYSIANSSR